MDEPGLIPPSGRDFPRNAEAERTDIVQVEGRPLAMPVELPPLTGMVATRVAPGHAPLPNQHPDHDGIVTVVSGPVQVTIARRAAVAGPGDAWKTAPGDLHIKALEPTTAIEAKSPPITAW